MLTTAKAFLNSLESDLQRRVMFPFAGAERGNWDYRPVPRQGLPLRVLSPRQRQAALALLEVSLSRDGYEKALGIMTLERILGELEGRSPDDRVRDPNGYFLTLFGTLEPDTPWGWRIDGHHLSLNFTSVRPELIATTPAFMGANPAEVPHGPRQGWRVLREEEDLARRLLAIFEPEQRDQVVIARQAPADILTGTRTRIALDDPAGLAAREMTEAQRELLMRLIRVYAHNLRPELAEAQLRRVRSAGLERLHFAWAGGLEKGAGHYYRVQGPTLLLEYDNTQNNANHIHTVMRDPDRDFGEDLLRRHYAECDHGR